MAGSRHIQNGLGVAVIGSGTIGRLRAQIAHRLPIVNYLAVCDIVEDKARKLAQDCEADDWTSDAAELVRRDDIDVVIVATTEDAHFEPALAAIEAGKPTLIEKPLTILPEEGDKLIAAAAENGVQINTGFTQRFRPQYLGIKEHVRKGYLGQITSAKATIYLTQAVIEAVMARAPSTTPAINSLTYQIDLLLWYLDGARPVSVYAQGGHGRFYDEYGTPDSTWSVLTFDNGTVATLGVSWELPEFWPAYVATMDFELFGRNGVLSVKDDHRDQLLVSNQAVPSPYTPHVSMNVALLGSAMPGDWSMDEFFGAMKEETSTWLNSVGTGRPTDLLASAQQGQDVTLVARAMDESMANGTIVTLTWD